MKYYIEYTGITEENGNRTNTKIGAASAQASTLLEVIQGFISNKEEQGVKIIKLKVQEDALNS